MARRLLERDHELATLLVAARDPASGGGSVVLLHGEAAIGKTSLVSALRSELPDGTRTAAVGPRLAVALQSGERDQVMDALLAELHQPPTSIALAVEDALAS